jgi:hypothetical protein
MLCLHSETVLRIFSRLEEKIILSFSYEYLSVAGQSSRLHRYRMHECSALEITRWSHSSDLFLT